MLALDPCPESGEEAAEEEALGSEERSGQPCLKEAHGSPRTGDGSSHESARAQGTHSKLVDRCHGSMIQRFVFGYREGGVNEEEEAGQRWERA